MAVEKVKKGEVITARYLNKIGRRVNDLEASVSSPKQKNPPASSAVQNQAAEDDTAEEVTAPTTFVETDRTISTVQVFDDEDTNYAEVERIETINFVNGNGETLSLQFANSVE